MFTANRIFCFLYCSIFSNGKKYIENIILFAVSRRSMNGVGDTQKPFRVIANRLTLFWQNVSVETTLCSIDDRNRNWATVTNALTARPLPLPKYTQQSNQDKLLAHFCNVLKQVFSCANSFLSCRKTRWCSESVTLSKKSSSDLRRVFSKNETPSNSTVTPLLPDMGSKKQFWMKLQ